MFGDARRAVIVGGAVVFGLGIFIGFLLGRSGRPEPVTVAPEPTGPTATGPSPQPSAVAPPPVVVTPPPGQEPAITAQGQILLEGDRAVVASGLGAPCQSLVSPGSLGECGDVPVAAGRVVWIVERSPTAVGTNSIRVRVFTFVSSAGGWVEWLQASDPTGERWSDVNVLSTDLTGDGVAELLVGFRGVGDAQTLDYDIVGYGEGGLPAVLAHPQPAPRGSVVVAGGQLQEYAAQYPNGEPACCPPSYLRTTIAYDAGFFREISTDSVTPPTVPASQL